MLVIGRGLQKVSSQAGRKAEIPGGNLRSYFTQRLGRSRQRLSGQRELPGINTCQ